MKKTKNAFTEALIRRHVESEALARHIINVLHAFDSGNRTDTVIDEDSEHKITTKIERK